MLRLANLSRWQAGGGHLLLSVAIGATVLAAMVLVWYPPPFFEATGGLGLVLLMIGVDLTQQLRFFVANPEVARDAARKGRGIAELKRLNPDRVAAIDAIVRASGRSESGLRQLAARAPNRDRLRGL